MSPALSRRSTAAALLSEVARAVVPDPSAKAKDAARRTALKTSVAPATPPRNEPTGKALSAAPSARSVDAAYRPRAAVGAPRASSVPRRAVARVTSGVTDDPTALHLARRATWGATPALVAEIRSRGAQAWVADQLDPARLVPDADCDALVARLFPRLSLATWEVHDRYWPNSTGDLGDDVIQSVLARALWSRRQLLEVMVEFWTNHLVVTAPWGDAWDSVHRFHVDVVRKYALGRYADMLVAAAKHPAMLAQLDNESSSKRSPNENFGREVLELHTVGVDGGYAESDIRTSALALTGMSTDDESGEYLYRHIRHHTGALSVLGWSDPNASAFGEAVGVSYLQHLARHPKTARRIATKLAVRFVSDTPPASLVDSLAAVYTANDTAIAPVLRTLFASAEFAASAGQKTKRPLERMVSVSRVLGVTPGPDTRAWLGGLSWYARVAGQAPLGWPAPNGYPDVAAAWAGANATLTAWNWTMAQGWTATESPAKQVVYPALRGLLPSTLPATHGAFVDALAARLLQVPLSSAKRDAVCAFLDKTATAPLKSTDAAVGWRLPYVVALLLDSPEFATR
ncbi:DUF1800 family protein [Phycicoccus avicenniae]|uniref:DUF1800 domain-containing protein n=1 Tax=Phycicoccus avicenniae TaxID=2828860 RepID=UPI003D2C0BAC